MSEDIWIAAGKPKYQMNADNKSWIPFFDASSGLLNGFEFLNEPDGEELRRFTLWSSLLGKKMGCNIHAYVNPYYLDELQRDNLLGMNWDVLDIDPADPTNDFETGGIFALFTLVHLPVFSEINTTESSGKLLRSIVVGESPYQPDYQRDGDVALVTPNGDVTHLKTLESAIEQLKRVRILFTNDFMKTWEEGIGDAKAISKLTNSQIVFIYIAQDILTLPTSRNHIYRERLKHLIRESVPYETSKSRLRIISHGWSGHIAASAVMHYKNIDHDIFSPAPGPWGKGEYLNALRHTKATVNVYIGDYDIVSLLGQGVSRKKTQMKKCIPATL
jgi:hypothetical protein